jgi:uncharacterized protein YggE
MRGTIYGKIHEKMRRTWLIGVCVAAAIAGWCSASAWAQVIQVNAGNRTISVTTHADAEQRADRASVHIGYQIYGPTSADVNAQAAQVSQAIADAVAEAGVAKDAIESESQSTGPTEAYQENGLTENQKMQRHFQASQSWTVKTGAESAAKVLAAAVAAGANQSGSIEWTVADDTALSAKAATQALRQAKTIAARMAQRLDTKVGMLLYASNQAEPVRVMPMMARAFEKTQSSNIPSTLSLSPPMVTRSATVSAVFAIQ